MTFLELFVKLVPMMFTQLLDEGLSTLWLERSNCIPSIQTTQICPARRRTSFQTRIPHSVFNHIFCKRLFQWLTKKSCCQPRHFASTRTFGISHLLRHRSFRAVLVRHTAVWDDRGTFHRRHLQPSLLILTTSLRHCVPDCCPTCCTASMTRLLSCVSHVASDTNWQCVNVSETCTTLQTIDPLPISSARPPRDNVELLTTARILKRRGHETNFRDEDNTSTRCFRMVNLPAKWMHLWPLRCNAGQIELAHDGDRVLHSSSSAFRLCPCPEALCRFHRSWSERSSCWLPLCQIVRAYVGRTTASDSTWNWEHTAKKLVVTAHTSPCTTTKLNFVRWHEDYPYRQHFPRWSELPLPDSLRIYSLCCWPRHGRTSSNVHTKLRSEEPWTIWSAWAWRRDACVAQTEQLRRWFALELCCCERHEVRFFLSGWIYMVQFSCLIAGRIRGILACDRANLSHTLVTHLWHDNIDSVAWHLTDVDGSCDRRSCVFVSSSTRRCTDISTGNFKMTIPLQRFRQIRFFSNALLNVDSNCLTSLDYAHMTMTRNACQIYVRCWILRCNVLHFFTACSDSEDRPIDTSCKLPWSISCTLEIARYFFKYPKSSAT